MTTCRKPPRVRKLGVYQLGDDWIKVCYQPDGRGGSFYILDKRMVIGLLEDRWRSVLAVLLHETMEFCLQRLNLGYERLDKWGEGTDCRMFLLNHWEFSEACALAAPFLTFVQPDLCRVYNKAQKRRERKERKAKL